MRHVLIRLLPDGSGRVRIHWFVRDESGPARTPGGVVPSSAGPLKAGGTRGRIACKPGQRDVGPHAAGGTIEPVPHTDDIRAATCDLCLATDEARKALAEIAEDERLTP